MNPYRLLFPALRRDPDRGFDHEQDAIDLALERGVGGFIFFGGAAEAVSELTAELRERADEPLLIGSDLERGAGQQFRGATALPPAAALGALDDLEATRRAGELTALDARALGVDWVYAPVADIDLEPENPIVGSRAFGTEPGRVARHVAAWIEGCRAGGALSCAKHFPGHGRTVHDSHLELPTVECAREELDTDLEPFRRAARAGVDSMMSAHVGYPALDASGEPATLSPPIITGLLRDQIGFDGLVVTDALVMEGVLEGGRAEGEAAVRAVAAGCDALLYLDDLDAAARALEDALGSELPEERLASAIGRVEDAARRAGGERPGEWGRSEDRTWALEVATRSLEAARGRPALPGSPLDVVTVDDDIGGPYPPPSRRPFLEALREAEVDIDVAPEASAERPALVALYADIRGWKGRPGLSEEASDAVARAVRTRPDAPVVLFGHPRLADQVPGDGPVLAAWGGERLMQRAAARWLTG